MRASKLVLRCYAVVEEGQWVAVCLDFDLAAQASTFEEAATRLKAQIRSYVREASVGVDHEHAGYLFRRRAPLNMWAKYYVLRVLSWFHARPNGAGGSRPFNSSLPLVPAC